MGRPRTSLHQPFAAVVTLVCAVLLATGCTTPISVKLSEPTDVRRELTSNEINSGNLSEPTRITLHLEGLSDRFETDPESAIARLHAGITEGWSTSDTFFALAETAFDRAQQTGKHPYYLAAAIYAYKFLFPDRANERPSGFDTRFRAACNIYNRSLAAAFASADGSRIALEPGRYALPFGTIDITFDASKARWGGQTLSNFTATDALRVDGLNIRYWQSGLGAPLAAEATSRTKETNFQTEPGVKIPVTALLRVEASPGDLAQGHLRGNLEVHPAFEPSSVTIAGQSVPLEVDTSAAFAFGLSDPMIWESEFAGLLDGNFFHRSSAQLAGLEPYRPDQFPVVFIHGTGSSAGRWESDQRPTE